MSNHCEENCSISERTLRIGIYDPANDVITIEGVTFSGSFFRIFGDGLGCSARNGQLVKIENSEDGVVTATIISENLTA